MDITSNRQSSSTSSKLKKKTSQTNSLGNDQLPNLQVNSPRQYERKQSRLTIGGLAQTRRSSHLSVTPRRAPRNEGEEQQESSRVDSVGPSNGSTVYDQAVSRYQCIASLTEQQNKNLRDQNIYLLEKLRKMQERESKVKVLYEKAKKYKVLWQQAQMQIQVLRDQCQIYKEQAEQMKKIILNDVSRLKQRVIQTQFSEEIDREDNKNENTMSQRSKISKMNSLLQTENQQSLSNYLKPCTQTF